MFWILQHFHFSNGKVCSNIFSFTISKNREQFSFQMGQFEEENSQWNYLLRKFWRKLWANSEMWHFEEGNSQWRKCGANWADKRDIVGDILSHINNAHNKLDSRFELGQMSEFINFRWKKRPEYISDPLDWKDSLCEAFSLYSSQWYFWSQ